MALYKRTPGGPWWTRFTVRGRHVRKSTNTADRALAEEFETALRHRYWRQANLGENVHTWREAVTRLKRETSWRPSTRTRNELALAFFDRINGVPVGAINADVVRAARDYVERTQGPASANRIMAVFRQVLRACVSWGWLQYSPPVPMVHVEEKEPVFVTKEQCAELIRQLPDHLRKPALFSILTGLRMANVRDLTWDRVDLDRGHLWVPSSHYKTKRTQGVTLSPEAVQLLKAIAGRREGRVFLYPAPVKGKKGETQLRPITGTFNTKAFRNARKRAGLEGVKWHSLRHTFASWLAAEGASDRVLQAAGGWASPRMVARYAHLRAGDLRPWVSAVGTNAVTALTLAIRVDEPISSRESMVPEEGLEPPTRALRKPKAIPRK